ncbi:MAG TPA: sugar phosphate isomerase/epimerase [Bacteroidaceae bacterium]|nr:sugar phosphate isomerase/epimerase [Bacteroidaceae bacterium]
MIEFSAFADEVTTDFEEQLKFLSSEKVQFIEIRFVDGKNIMDLNEKELSRVRELLKKYRIRVSAIGSPVGKVSLEVPISEHIETFRHAFYLAKYFGTKFIRVFSYYAPEGENIDDYGDEVILRMKEKVKILNGSGIMMVHENESHIFGHSAANCVALVKGVNSSNFKLVYDPANFVWGEDIANNMEVCWPQMKPFVIHIHIKDWKVGSSEVGSMPGKGDGQIPELLKELKNMNYNGFLTMEPHLKSGGQFGGDTGPELFSEAISFTRKLCDEVGLDYK